ncbi:PREDICTED: uncharacterized protein LOC108751549 [Trachymyrmex septentrionalis]|uniref:uncharacterized protein LOC108751549 n=1 Tax=Trachymyrmex septentrionalis TaxID=34720 RepID=UPI00084F63DA|nr:PREDICTED: uncharacterized protein LOC108751549 [Trachymyrmex septentrionalis]
MTPGELYFAQNLCLPADLLRGSFPKTEEVNSLEDYLGKVKRKLEEIHKTVRKRVDIRSSQTKSWYDQKARQIHFKEGQKLWLYNPRRKKGRTPKLQSNWKGPYYVVKKLSASIYCIRKSNKYKNKVVHSDRLAPYAERQSDS